MTRIVCIGSMNMDIAAYGEALPRPGETVFGHTVVSSPGGKGLNQAVAARRLGAEVAFVGNLGRDQAGDALAHFLAAEGIDTTGVRRLSEQPTGTALILVDAGSQNAIVVIPGANMVWPTDAASDLELAAGDLVVAQFEIPDAVIATAFAAARRQGARTILNAAPARAMPAALWPLVDILVVNETELAAAAGTAVDAEDVDAITSAAVSLAGRGPVVVATLGHRGAVVASPSGGERIAGLEVVAVDTAGAGDCYIGALAAALARGEALAAAARFANRAAAVQVTRRGTAVAMPRADEV